MNKEISKEEANKPNKEQSIEILKQLEDDFPLHKYQKQALTLAIEALEQKPSGEYEDAYDVLIGIAGKSRVDNNAVKTTECIKAMHEFHNQFPSVKQCGCMTHCNCPIFQPPVISDEEIEKQAKNYSHDKSEQIDFTLGMKVMRKLLTNKEY